MVTLQLTQAVTSVPSSDTDQGFATADRLPHAVFIAGPGQALILIALTGFAGSANAVPREILGEDGAVPALAKTEGPTTAFSPNLPGNYQLIASVGGNAACVARFAILTASVQSGDRIISGDRFLRTEMDSVPATGMALNAQYLIHAGQQTPAVGSDRVRIGCVGNLLADTFQVEYASPNNPQPSSFTETLSKRTPILDTDLPPNGGADDVFRSSSRANDITSSGGAGQGRRLASLTAGDSPEFSWAQRTPGYA